MMTIADEEFGAMLVVGVCIVLAINMPANTIRYGFPPPRVPGARKESSLNMVESLNQWISRKKKVYSAHSISSLLFLKKRRK